MANKAQKFELLFVIHNSGPLNWKKGLFLSYINKKHKQGGSGRGEPLQSKEMDKSIPYQQFHLLAWSLPLKKSLVVYRKLVS